MFPRPLLVGAVLLAGLAAPKPATAAPAAVPVPPTTVLVSASAAGPAAGSSVAAGVSADGRYVVFSSYASSIRPGATPDDSVQTYRRDLLTGHTELASRTSTGERVGRNDLEVPFGESLSPDGRYVGFASAAPGVVPDDTDGHADVFVRDSVLHRTERVSLGFGDGQSPQDSIGPASFSADGRYVAFARTVPGTFVASDVWVRDRLAGRTTRAARGADEWVLSRGGRSLVFTTDRALVPDDTGGGQDVYVRDLMGDDVQRVSVGEGGRRPEHGATSPALSADGRYVTFTTPDPLVADDRDGLPDVYRRDLVAGRTVLVSGGSAGGRVLSAAGGTAAVSRDGRYVAFDAPRTRDANGDPCVPGAHCPTDVYVRDLVLGGTRLVSRAGPGAALDAFSGGMSDDGRVVAFTTEDAVPPLDRNDSFDAYVRDLGSTVGPTRP